LQINLTVDRVLLQVLKSTLWFFHQLPQLLHFHCYLKEGEGEECEG
jgi:hypothetical protein